MKKEKLKEELLKIKNKYGKLTPELVYKEAKKKTNPLHKLLDWDNKVAGKKWRLHQCRMLILQVRITYEKTRVPEFLQVNVEKDDETEKEYVTQPEITDNMSWREQVLRQAYNSIKYWEKKYRYLSELKPIFDGIKEVEKKLKEKQEITVPFS